jgi:hypothetical protein
MTTAATPISKPVSGHPAPVAEHWWLLLVLVSVVAGFWPSFFNRLRAQDLSHSLHGFIATGWLLGLILQSWLIGRRERTWHRRVAMAMIPMAIAMIVTAVPMIQAILRTGQQQPGFQPIARMLVMYDVSTLLLFTGLLSLALVSVRQPAVHRRALSATALVAIPPALARFFNGPLIGLDFTVSLHASFVLGYLILAWLIFDDRRRGVRDRVYPGTLAAIVGIEFLMAPVSTTAAWITFTDTLIRP